MWKTCLYFVVIFAIFTVSSVTYAAIFTNPIGSDSFPELFNSVAKALITIAIPLAVVAIIIAGLRFVIAGSKGDQAEITQVRKIFWWIVIGSAIIVGGSLLVNAVVNTIKDFN
jgi:Na+-driven multidrug efflux pump